jgi:hypothetical protein
MSERIAVVTWLDASRSDDTARGDGPIGILRHTVGYILRRDDTGVVIAMSRDEAPQGVEHEREFRIPASYIKRVRLLK